MRRAELSVKRTHGLGNLIMLMPVIDRLTKVGVSVHVATRPEWIEALHAGRPSVDFGTSVRGDTIDLDEATADLLPSEHRTLEFARQLGVSGPFDPPHLNVPETWAEPFRQFSGSIVLAPEAGHPARSWTQDKLHELAVLLQGDPVVLAGLHREKCMPCLADLRGQLNLQGILGLLKQARAVICFDSGMLHLALACSVPVLAIFGGIDPSFRIFPMQHARVLQASMACCPCNKAETCDGLYPCLTNLTPRQVVAELAMIEKNGGRSIIRIGTAQYA